MAFHANPLQTPSIPAKPTPDPSQYKERIGLARRRLIEVGEEKMKRGGGVDLGVTPERMVKRSSNTFGRGRAFRISPVYQVDG
jgi:hypothetical protein